MRTDIGGRLPAPIDAELILEMEGGASRIRFREDDEGFFVETVFVPAMHRGRGIGSVLLDRVLRLADAFRVPVRLTARPIGRGGPEADARLRRYYARFGFVVVDEGESVPKMLRPAASGPDGAVRSGETAEGYGDQT